MTTPIDTSPEAVECVINSIEPRPGTSRFLTEDAANTLRALRSALTASEKQLAVANKLWTMCVQDGWPWAEGSIQDSLTELGLLYAKDMTDEESGPECTNCEGDCRTCYRAVTRIEDAAMEKANG